MLYVHYKDILRGAKFGKAGSQRESLCNYHELNNFYHRAIYSRIYAPCYYLERSCYFFPYESLYFFQFDFKPYWHACIFLIECLILLLELGTVAPLAQTVIEFFTSFSILKRLSDKWPCHITVKKRHKFWLDL